MPRYYKQHKGGYDLDRETPFHEVDGVRYILGTAGSFIMVCRTCGAEHFRERVSEHENCFHGHGKMVPLTYDNNDEMVAIWKARGDTFFSVETLRAERLKREAERPLDWQFGSKTEADFPLGYVKDADETKK